MIFFSILGEWQVIGHISPCIPTCLLLHFHDLGFNHLKQGNLELYLHQFRSLYSLLHIVFSSVWLVSILGFVWFGRKNVCKVQLVESEVKQRKWNENIFFHMDLFRQIHEYVCDCFLLLFAASVGLSFLQFTNMNSLRNLFITGVSMFLGLSIPGYFREYTAASLHGPAHTKAGWVSWSFSVFTSLSSLLTYPRIKIPSITS